MKNSRTAHAAAGVALVALLSGGIASAQSVDNHALATRLVTQFVEAENSGNVDLFDAIFPVNYVQHSQDVPQGLAGVRTVFAEQFKALRDRKITAHATVESITVDGDMVVLRQLFTIQKDGKTSVVRSLDEWRIANGLLAEHWDSDQSPHPADH